MPKQSLEKATVRELAEIMKGKRVFLRSDLNVPLDENQNITDQTRITASLETLRYLLDRGARVVLASHLGRPKGRDEKQSLRPVYECLKGHLPKTVIKFAPDCVGKETEAMVKSLGNGEVCLLENLRFHKEETANDMAFAKKLGELCDYYVNDAFGAAHRAHASTHGITRYVPAVMGFLIEAEVKILGEALNTPKRPFTVILGGKKVSDKIGVLENLVNIADNILVGGGMAFTFVEANGGKVGGSVVDPENLEFCRQIQKTAAKRGVKLVIATDCVAADEFAPNAHTQSMEIGDIPDGWLGLDIGNETVESFCEIIEKSGTIMWNGPMGVSEFDAFASGTREIAKAVAQSGAITILGGGDTISAAARLGFGGRFTHTSTGGGASLEFMEGKTLPGIWALLGKEARIK